MQWIFGLDRLHRINSTSQRHDLLAAALDCGASGFDVAPMYGNGMGEKTLGDYLKGANCLRERILLNTKFGIPYAPYGLWPNFVFRGCRVIELVARRTFKRGEKRCFTSRFLQDSVEESLRRLKTDYIDTLFIHEPLLLLDENENEDVMNALSRLRTEGKVRKAGVSGGNPCVLDIALELKLDVLQAPLSILNTPQGYSGELSAYHIRRSLGATSSQMLRLSDYYRAADSVKASTVLFQTTQLAHLKEFAEVSSDGM